MKLSAEINLEFTKANFLALLSYGENPKTSPYSHKQIAEWCERFWNKFSDVDAESDVEIIMPILADVETQWDLYIVNTFATEELKDKNLDLISLPVEWFKSWLAEVNT